MLMTTGSLGHVRAALEGITGQPVAERSQQKWLMIIARGGRDLDVVDSLRRHGIRAFWASYEELTVTRQIVNGQPVRRLKRIGIVPGIVFTPADGSRDMTVFLEQIVGAVDFAKKASGAPLLVDDDDIEIIRRIDGTTEQAKPSKAHDFKVGDKVRFKDDINRRWPPGLIIKVVPNGRISVEVPGMGRKLELRPLPHQIERT